MARDFTLDNSKNGNTPQISDEVDSGLGRRLGNMLNINRSASPAQSLNNSIKSTKSAKSLRSVRTNKSIQIAHATGFPELDSIPDDDLPDDKKELEVTLNWHISELNYLEKHIGEANDNFSQDLARIEACFDRDADKTMPKAMAVKNMYIDSFRWTRDCYQLPVAYHRNELNRIRDKRIKMNQAAGLDREIPDLRINDDAV